MCGLMIWHTACQQSVYPNHPAKWLGAVPSYRTPPITATAAENKVMEKDGTWKRRRQSDSSQHSYSNGADTGTSICNRRPYLQQRLASVNIMDDLKPTAKDGVTKSNPSKRHRERLNAELDTLASLLPFEQNILSKLDRLSILRLSVSYLRTKSYFQVVLMKDKDDLHHEHQYRHRELATLDHAMLDGDMFLQALNGFLLILSCEGEVFFATHSIESYLGFHQSDIVHQSVYELVHSEDREELQRQLLWNSFLPQDNGNMSLGEALMPEHYHLLERSFTVRFRCLLDNTSGFLRLDIRGRIKILHGQNRKTEEPPLALFAICTPFGPPSLLEVPQKEVMFKSKHKLDLALVSMDQRGKMLLGYSDAELANMGGYDLVHYDDLAYVASAHQELLKTGASGMIAYRFQTQSGQWQWLQTSSRLVYKNSKPDFVISTHRPLMEEEGRDLLGKRTMDFKVSYLDAGLTNSYFADSDQLIGSTPSTGSVAATPQRVNRRYKTQLRDFLSTCRTKRKIQSQATPTVAASSPAATVEYIPAPESVYSNLNPVYTAGYSDTSYMSHGNFQHSLYPVDNRFLSTGDLFHQYAARSYYPDYTTPYNGFLPTYETPVLSKDPCQSLDQTKYATVVDARSYVVSSPKCLDSTGYVMTSDISMGKHYTPSSTPAKQSPVPNSAGSSPTATANGIITPKVEEMKTDITGHMHYSPTAAQERQTVLMWGSTGSSNRSTPNKPMTNGTPYTMENSVHGTSDPLKSLAEMNSSGDGTCKWQTGIGKAEPVSPTRVSSPKRYQDPAAGEVYHQHQQYQFHQYYPYTPYHHHATQPEPGGYPQINRTGVLCCPSLR